MDEILDTLQSKYHLTDREKKLLQFTYVGLIYSLYWGDRCLFLFGEPDIDIPEE